MAEKKKSRADIFLIGLFLFLLVLLFQRTFPTTFEAMILSFQSFIFGIKLLLDIYGKYLLCIFFGAFLVSMYLQRTIPSYIIVDIRGRKIRFHNIGKPVAYFTRTIAGKTFDCLITARFLLLYYLFDRLPLLNKLSRKTQLLMPYGKFRNFESEVFKGSPINPTLEQRLVSLHKEIEGAKISAIRKRLKTIGISLRVPKLTGRACLVVPMTKDEVLDVWIDEKPEVIKEAREALDSPLLRDVIFVKPPCSFEDFLSVLLNVERLADLEIAKQRSINKTLNQTTKNITKFMEYVVSVEGTMGTASRILDLCKIALAQYHTFAEIRAEKLGITLARAELLIHTWKLGEVSLSKLADSLEESIEIAKRIEKAKERLGERPPPEFRTKLAELEEEVRALREKVGK